MPLLTSYKVTRPFLRDVNSEIEARNLDKHTLLCEVTEKHTSTEVGS